MVSSNHTTQVQASFLPPSRYYVVSPWLSPLCVVSRILRSEMEDEGIPPNKIFLGGFSQVHADPDLRYALLLTCPDLLSS